MKIETGRIAKAPLHRLRHRKKVPFTSTSTLSKLTLINQVCISPEEEAIASKASVIDVREFCLLVFVQITRKRYIDRELPSPAYIQSLKNKPTGQIQIL